MQWIYDILAIPLGYVMRFCYAIIPNYAGALLLITILTRLIMIPSTIKQQKSSAKMARIQPKIRAIQEKYRDDRDKMNEELQKVYSEENYSPYSGCLPLLIQMPVFFGLIGVIYKPLTYLLQLDSGLIAQATKAIGGVVSATNISNMAELYVLKYADMGFIKSIFPNGFDLKLTFFGLDLTQTPSLSNFNWLLIIPLLTGVTQFLSTVIAQKQSGQKVNFAMSITMPLISVWFTFMYPAAVGLYWFYSALIATIQSWLIRKFYNPNRSIARNLVSKANKRRSKFAQ